MTVETAGPAESATRRRSVAGWIGIAVVLLLVGGIGAALSGVGRWAERDALDPESAGPLGTRALVEILREQGVEVVVARDRDGGRARARAGAARPSSSPMRPRCRMTRCRAVADAAADVVLIDPRSRTLASAPARRRHGRRRGPAGRRSPAATCPTRCGRARSPRARSSRPAARRSTPATRPATASGSSSARHRRRREAASRPSTAAPLFTNEHLAENGNAALAVNLMGRHPTRRLVHAEHRRHATSPNARPDARRAHPALGEPGHRPAARRRRRGRASGAGVGSDRSWPERLPVTVRAAETTEGRARLYAHVARRRSTPPTSCASAPSAASAALLGLGPPRPPARSRMPPPRAPGCDRGAVRGILIDDTPPHRCRPGRARRTRLRHLEEAVHAAVRPGKEHPMTDLPRPPRRRRPPTTPALREAMNRVRIEVGKAVDRPGRHRDRAADRPARARPRAARGRSRRREDAARARRSARRSASTRSASSSRPT